MSAVYNFPNHISGTTFNGALFTFEINVAPADVADASMTFTNPLKSEKILTPGAGLTLVPGGFEVDAQVIDWDPSTYIYKNSITLVNGYKKEYVRGKWKITSR